MDITTIKTIPHASQRYPTVGDWEFIKGRGWISSSLVIKVSDMQNTDYEFLVGMHELIEAYLCKKRGIKEEDVTKFDIEFESTRPDWCKDEPGDHPLAPYIKEHQFATQIEKLIAKELGVNWEEYDATVSAL